MGVGHFLFSLALGATRFPVGSFHVVHQFSFRNEHLSFLSWDLLHSWQISEILKKGFARAVFTSIKDDQTLVRLQEPFHILHRPSLIEKHGCFQKLGVLPPKWMVKIIEKPNFLMDDLGGFNPLFSETSTCTSWDPLNSFNFLSTLRHDLSVPWQWVNSVLLRNVHGTIGNGDEGCPTAQPELT